jgi:heptaprenyl diphosphate synthase
MQPILFKSGMNPRLVFFTGLVIIPLYLLTDHFLLRALQAAAFFALALLSGKRIRPLYFIMLTAGVTFFNLLTPFGKVLFYIGFFPVTEGALRFGLFKGLTISGLVFISLFSVRKDLILPGKLGGVFAKLFYYFERLLEGKKKIRLKTFIADIDGILEAIHVPGTSLQQDASANDYGGGAEKAERIRGTRGSAGNAQQGSFASYLLLLLLVLLNAAAALYSVIVS